MEDLVYRAKALNTGETIEMEHCEIGACYAADGVYYYNGRLGLDEPVACDYDTLELVEDDDETWGAAAIGGVKLGMALGIALVVSYAIVRAVILIESLI